MLKKLLLLLITLSAYSAFAQQPKTIALKAARMFDGTSDSVTSNGVIIIEGNHIKQIGGAIPANAQVIDLGDATLMPGLIDAHVHLTEESGDNWYLDYFQTLMRQPAEQALLATTFARKTIEAGFTTVRNVGASDYVDVGLRNAINNGWVVGPRMLVAVHAIGATGGHGDGDPIPPARGFSQSGPIDGVCNGPSECRAAVRYQIKYGADVIKFMPSGGVLSLSDPVDAPELSQEEMNAIVEEAHHWGRKVAAHCHGAAQRDPGRRRAPRRRRPARYTRRGQAGRRRRRPRQSARRHPRHRARLVRDEGRRGRQTMMLGADTLVPVSQDILELVRQR